MIVFQQAQSFSTINRRVVAPVRIRGSARKQQDVSPTLMIPFRIVTRQIFLQGVSQRRLAEEYQL